MFKVACVCVRVKERACVYRTHYLQLEVVSETRGAVHSDQHCVLLLGAEAYGQAVRPRARPVVGWPGVHNQPAITTKNVRSSRCRERERVQLETVCVQRLVFKQRIDEDPYQCPICNLYSSVCMLFDTNHSNEK